MKGNLFPLHPFNRRTGASAEKKTPVSTVIIYERTDALAKIRNETRKSASAKHIRSQARKKQKKIVISDSTTP